jgi:hypothetical protein
MAAWRCGGQETGLLNLHQTQMALEGVPRPQPSV